METLSNDPAEIERPGADSMEAQDRPSAARDVAIDASDGTCAEVSEGPKEWTRVGAAMATVRLHEVKHPLCKLEGAGLLRSSCQW